MIKSILKGLVLSSVAILLVAAPAAAQIGWSLGAGISKPSTDGADNGWHALGAATFTLPALPIAIRADAIYHSFNGASIIGVDGDAKWNIIPGPLSPYAIGGLSWGSTSFDGGGDAVTDFGWNLGGGLDFGLSKLSFFAEARYVTLGGNDGIIPITLGLRF